MDWVASAFSGFGLLLRQGLTVPAAASPYTPASRLFPVPRGHVLIRRLCVQPLPPLGRIARWFSLRVDAGRGTARSAVLSRHAQQSFLELLEGILPCLSRGAPQYADDVISPTGPHCNEPLLPAGSFASSIVLFARPSLFGDGPVLTGGFPFLSASRFPDGIVTIRQQAVSYFAYGQPKAKTDDEVLPQASLLAHHQLPHTHVRLFYRTPPLIFKSNSSYGSFILLPLRFLEE
ncbi:hypothetical protein T09_5456 [Trichinella sp. T9]|nr:hypothetical protein T09_5456 [Trichinella sp. T9]